MDNRRSEWSDGLSRPTLAAALACHASALLEASRTSLKAPTWSASSLCQRGYTYRWRMIS
jgi:hypothetical protein